jgi:hypothetical protein
VRPNPEAACRQAIMVARWPGSSSVAKDMDVTMVNSKVKKTMNNPVNTVSSESRSIGMIA